MSRIAFKVFVDWDGTLTQRDTLELVARAGYNRRKQDHSPHSLRSPQHETDNHLIPWTRFGELYLEDYAEHKASYKPIAQDRTTVAQERQWLESLLHVETQSVDRVQASGLFKGVTAAGVEEVATAALADGDLRLRKGWTEFLHFALTNATADISNPSQASSATVSQVILTVLSVNWSEHFIKSTMHLASTQAESGGDISASLDASLRVYANEIAGLEKPDGSDGTIIRQPSDEMRIGSHKLSRMPLRCQQNLKARERGSARERPGNDDPWVIYAGDSAGDLECLLAADFGICIRDKPMGSSQSGLADALQRLGISTAHVDGLDRSLDGTVWWAHDFEEICSALQKLEG